MISLKKYTFFFLLLLIVTPSIKAQNNQVDSLSKLSFEVLEDHYKKSLFDSIKKQSAQAFLLKAKREKNTLKTADGYYILSEIFTDTSLSIKYTDSIIFLTKDLNHKIYPAKAYLQKGIQSFYLNKNSEAIENYLNANEYYKNSENEYGQLCVKHYIGLLKSTINEPKESLKMFRENIMFFNNKEKQIKHKKQYLKSIYALADSYNQNKLLDSAEMIGKIGLIKSRKNKSKFLYPYFLLSYGITKNLKKEYNIAIDSLLKSTQLIKNDKINLAFGNLSLYKSFLGNKQPIKAFEYLKKNDSLFKLHPDIIIIEAKETYQLLYNHYKRNGDSEKYLETIEQLLVIDDIIKKKHIQLRKTIVDKYEVPNLLAEKEQVILKLTNSNSSKKLSIFILITITFLLSFLTFKFIKKNRINKKRFKILIQEFDSKKKLSSNKNTNLIKTTTTTGLSEELVKDVLNKLLIFEKSNKFIKNNYTLNSLAKELKTNSSYLSKIINNSKEGNFTNYLNKLRIEYAINKLKTARSFRLYTVQAIAEDTGFNRAQSFSTAFKKQTGISITYFVKQLAEAKAYDYK
jgi:AraC-like DNA-binding protein